jgi:hypothetical protein
VGSASRRGAQHGVVVVKDLGVFVKAGEIVVAIPIRWVTRLLLPTGGISDVLEIDGRRHAAWKLDSLLGLPASSETRSWILLDLPLPIALETGPCLAVEELPSAARLPARSLTDRVGGIDGAFQTPRATFGLVVDPSRLFTARELETSAALLGSAP